MSECSIVQKRFKKQNRIQKWSNRQKPNRTKTPPIEQHTKFYIEQHTCKSNMNPRERMDEEIRDRIHIMYATQGKTINERQLTRKVRLFKQNKGNVRFLIDMHTSML